MQLFFPDPGNFEAEVLDTLRSRRITDFVHALAGSGRLDGHRRSRLERERALAVPADRVHLGMTSGHRP